VLAVHSLSKRSNLAGVRAGFYAGDPELVQYLSEVRKHAGMMPPAPVQAAAAVALEDDLHVDACILEHLPAKGAARGEDQSFPRHLPASRSGLDF